MSEAIRRSCQAPAVIAVMLGVVGVIGVVSFPDHAQLLERGYLLTLGALAVWTLARMIRLAYPTQHDSPFVQALRPRSVRVTRPTELERLEHDVRFACSSARDFHARLRPPLRAIATERLVARRSLDVAVNRDAAQAVLGTQVWEALFVERELPDFQEPGVAMSTLRVILDTLEAL